MSGLGYRSLLQKHRRVEAAMLLRRVLSAPRECALLRASVRRNIYTTPSFNSAHNTFLGRNALHSSNRKLEQETISPNPGKPAAQQAKLEPSRGKRTSRSPAGKTSLRRAAVEAQISKDVRRLPVSPEMPSPEPKVVTAYAVAERFDIAKVMEILLAKGYEPDPLETGLYPQVVHIQVPLDSIRRTTSLASSDLPSDEVGDVFVFPSGTVVSWSLPETFASYLATTVLLPAAENPHIERMETEDLDYIEDPQRDSSLMKGDVIILGTNPVPEDQKTQDIRHPNRTTVDTVLTKIAFSSGLARSTKLAVLESLLLNYFDSTRNIPTQLSKGSRLPYTRSFILRKTGQLLSLRAQLNLYSELTDSLPDIFWDSRHELGLEGNYDQVGKALDVGIRIKVLNEKMDYAQEIASVLRERLSETHGLRLEWTIILLIAVEVCFEVLRLWKERKQELAAAVKENRENPADEKASTS